MLPGAARPSARLRGELAGAVGALVLLASAGIARAAEPTWPVASALMVEPNACFDAATLGPQVVRWLGRGAVDRRVELEIRGDPRSPSGAELLVRRDGQVVSGRSFPPLAGSCEEVGAAVSLGAALAIDATVLASLGVVVSPPPPPPPAPPAAAPPVHVGVAATIEGGALLGVLTQPAPLVAPGVEILLTPRLALRVAGLLSTGHLAVGGARAEVTLLAGRAEACAALDAPAVVLRACAGVAAGRLEASGAGPLTVSYVAAAPWVAGVAGLRLRRPLTTWLELGVSADLVIPFTRPTLEVVDVSGALAGSRQVPPLGAALGLGPTLVFR